MRIVGGKNKGLRFSPPKGFNSRPTTDFAKEALFNILHHQFDLEGAKVLDLFAGTGSISYEFDSRGASAVWSVEQNVKCTRFISENAKKCGFNSIQVYTENVFSFLERNKEGFDIVFADPPYDFKDYPKLIASVLNSHTFGEEAVFILEHGKENQFNEFPNFSYLRNYGGVQFSFFEQ